MTSLLDRPGPTRTALAALAALHHLPPVLRSRFGSGMRALDQTLDGGILPGELALVVGKPAVGKTILALQWARHVAHNGGVAVYACYEHDETTLIGRLLASELGDMVAEGHELVSGTSAETLVESVRRVGAGQMLLADAVNDQPAIAEAHRRVARYADRLVLAASCRLDADALADVVLPLTDDPVTLFVDYVQKVPAGVDVDGVDTVTSVGNRLKSLALDAGIAVVGLAAVDDSGLASRRIHTHHVRGASALAYEADVVLVMNDKLDIVSRAHLANSPMRADEFRRQVVVSVEKNRRGAGSADIEFDKDFVSSRFESTGRWVAERLWSEGSLEQ